MSSSGGPSRRDRIAERMREFAAAMPELPLYHSICAAAADDPDVVDVLLAAQPGQGRPVLLLAAIHDVILRLADEEQPPPVARWYASVVGRENLPTADAWADPGPWPEVRDFILAHRPELESIIATHSTQTNEVNRSTYVLSMLAEVAAGRPVAVIEFGSSAGLLLTPDHYDVRLTTAENGLARRWGDPASAVHASGVCRGRVPPQVVPVASRVGVDVDPIAPDDEVRLRWLQACLWPDVPGRVERFRAAVEQRRALPEGERPVSVRGDMTDPEVVQHALGVAAESGVDHVVALTSWSVTYVERSRREAFAQALAQFSGQVAVSWCSAEPTGAVPGLPAQVGLGRGDTQLGWRQWRHRRELPSISLGSADPHGRWVNLTHSAG